MQNLDLKAIGARIRTLRDSLELSAADLSDQAGINVKTLSLFENGHRTPSKKLLAFLATKYKANQEWIDTGRGEMISNEVMDEKQVHNLHAKVIGLEKELSAMKGMMEQIMAKIESL